MNEQHFNELAQQGFNRIPVTREVLADMETPLSTYLKLGKGRYSYLFESVQGGEKWGRYSIIGMKPDLIWRCRGKVASLNRSARFDPEGFEDEAAPPHATEFVTLVPASVFGSGSSASTFEIDEDGFIQDPDQWDEAVAASLAKTEGVDELTEDHWKLVNYLREYYLEYNMAPMIRKLCKQTNLSLKEVYDLFPSGPAKGACKVAGLPKPTGCV